MSSINLTQRDIDLIGRVVATEVPGWIARSDPSVYNAMVYAVVDTITNRVASSQFPNTVEGVLNQNRAFSKIGGPPSLNPYGTAAKAPPASPALQNLVTQHVTARAQGTPSTVGGSLHYANPHHSDRKNVTGWINDMIQAGATKLGLKDSVHFHGTAPGFLPAPEYSIAIEGVPGAPVDPNLPQTVQAPTLRDDLATGTQIAQKGLLEGFAVPSPAGDISRGLLGPAYMADIAPAGTQVASLTGAPVGAVEKAGGLPSAALAHVMSPGLMAPGLAPAPVGEVTRGTLGPAVAADALATGTSIAPPGSRGFNIGSAPVGPVQTASLGPAFSTAPAGTQASALSAAPVGAVEKGGPLNDAVSIAAPGTMAEALAAAPVGQVDKGLLGMAQVDDFVDQVSIGTPAPRGTDPAEAYAQMAASMSAAGLLGTDGRIATAAPNSPDRVDNHAAAGPKGLGGPGGLYVSSAAKAPAQQVAVAPPPAPITQAPALPAPREIATRQVASVPAAAPTQAPAQSSFPSAPPAMPTGSAALNGVFSGQLGQAGSASHPGTTFSNLGNGMIGRTDAYGNVTASQASQGLGNAGAVPYFGSLGNPFGGLGIGNSQQGVRGGSMGGQGLGQSLGRGAIGMGGGMLGSMAGGLLGPIGAIAGGLLGRAAGGHLANGIFGPQQQTVSALQGNANVFPASPQMLPGGFTDPTFSNLSFDQMSAISPGAAGAIAAGHGGLY